MGIIKRIIKGIKEGLNSFINEVKSPQKGVIDANEIVNEGVKLEEETSKSLICNAEFTSELIANKEDFISSEKNDVEEIKENIEHKEAINKNEIGQKISKEELQERENNRRQEILSGNAKLKIVELSEEERKIMERNLAMPTVIEARKEWEKKLKKNKTKKIEKQKIRKAKKI